MKAAGADAIGFAELASELTSAEARGAFEVLDRNPVIRPVDEDLTFAALLILSVVAVFVW